MRKLPPQHYLIETKDSWRVGDHPPKVGDHVRLDYLGQSICRITEVRSDSELVVKKISTGSGQGSTFVPFLEEVEKTVADD